MTSRPSTAAPILAAILSLMGIALAGCYQSGKVKQIRQGVEDVDRHSKEIEEAAAP